MHYFSWPTHEEQDNPTSEQDNPANEASEASEARRRQSKQVLHIQEVLQLPNVEASPHEARAPRTVLNLRDPLPPPTTGRCAG
jgi:hypothetical protein